MLKASLVAAALFAGGMLSPAAAQDMRAQTSCGTGGYGQNCYHNDYGSGGGYNRYCPPGYYPHVFPNGNGIRCEEVDGDSHFESSF